MSDINYTNQTRFFFQLYKYGVSRVILSAEFLISIAVFISLIIDRHYELGIFHTADGNSVIAVFAAASTLFAITLAALAIILSFSSSELMIFLRSHDKLSPLLFLFWLGNASYLIVVMLALVYLTVDVEKISFLGNYLYPLIATFFIYSLINTFYLLGAIIRFGLFMDVLDRIKKSDQ